MNKVILLLLLAFCYLPTSTQAQDAPDVLQALEFRNVGPTRGGRVTTVTGVAARPSEFYMGSTGGGLWKTTNYGHSWKNISDGYFKTPSMGAVRVSKANPAVIYAGTGSDGIRSNVIVGKGVYKSSDSGKTWEHIGLEKVGQIGAVEIDPASPNRVFVAAIGQPFAPNPERGVYRTLDGGENWEKVLFVSDKIGAADLEFAPDNAMTIYASFWKAERKPWTIISGGMQEGGIYKSTDGGNTWKQLKEGLPTGLIGKIDLAVSADDPNRLYTLVEAPQGEGGLFRSDDRGESFTLVSTKKELLDRPFYYCNVDANPQNANTVYVNSTRAFRSYDGGKNWKRISTPHGDNHDVWMNPNDTLTMVQGNDGGANVSTDGGKTWSTQMNQSTAELYQVEVDDQFPYRLYAGQQDNSTIMVPSLPPYNSIAGASAYWQAVGGCETGPVVPKPGNPDIVYANCKGRFGVFNKRTGQEMQYYVGASNMYGHNPRDLKFRFQRVSPIHVSPHNPDVVYHASQYLHKTTDDGKTWEIISPDLTAFTPETQKISGSPITRDITGEEFYSTIYAVRESPLEEGLIWVGANDGLVHITKDAGKNWDNITPKGLPSGGRVQCVEPSPHQAGKAYIAVYRYLLGDWKPYIYKTENYGKKWELLTTGDNGIPADYPTRVIREDPAQEGLLYAGTEFGLFISFDDGKQWQPFQQNLPVTPITDMKVHHQDLVLSTMGRGFWILDDVTPLHQTRKSTLASNTLFKPRDTYRMRYRGNGKARIPHYPRPSMLISYYLSEEIKGEILLDILDAKGELVRSYTSEKPSKEAAEQEPDMATGFYPRGSNIDLKKTAGSHRVKWDLRVNGPWHEDRERSGRNGPMAAPGEYTIRLTIGEQVLEQKANLLPDPRVLSNGVLEADILAQADLRLSVRDLLSKARQMEHELDTRKEKLVKELEAVKEDKQRTKEIEKIDRLLQELSTAEGRYMQPQLVAQLSYLYSMLGRADQKPGKDAYDRFEELKAWFANLQPQFDAALGSL